MATVSYDKLFPLVQPHVPGCPNVVIESHIAEAAADFCVRSELWRVDLESELTTISENLFEVDVPNGAKLEDILWLAIDGVELTRVSDKYISQNDFMDEGTPQFYALYADTYARLYPTPDAAFALTGNIVLKPSLTATGLEDFIYETYGRSIAYGAVAEIMAIPMKEWTNPMASASYMAKFYRDADAAKARDHRKVPMRIQARPFA